MVHSLRGWPTPLGIALQTSERGVASDGTVESPELAARIDAMADQVLSLVRVAAACAGYASEADRWVDAR